MNYFLLKSGEQSGPFTFEQLRSMWHTGQITSETPYWHDGLPDWMPLMDIASRLDAISENSYKPITSIHVADEKRVAVRESESGISGLVVFLLVMAILAGGGYAYYDSYLRPRAVESKDVEAITRLANRTEAIVMEKNLLAIKAGKVRHSMTKSDVLRSLGQPTERKRVTEEPFRQRFEEAWFYERNIISQVFFGYDGLVVGFSNDIEFNDN